MFLALVGCRKLGELLKYLSHLVSSLSASDVDNALRVGVLGKGLRNACLSATESTWNGAGSSQHRRIKGVEHSLACEQRLRGLQLLNDGSWRSDWPLVAQAEFVLLARSCVFESNNWLGNSIIAGWHDFDDFTGSLGISHDLMVLEKSVFIDVSNDITSRDE